MALALRAENGDSVEVEVRGVAVVIEDESWFYDCMRNVLHY